MSEEAVKGPIADAIKAKIAKIIENPEQFIAFVKLLIAMFPKKTENPVFGVNDADIAELVSLCEQAAAE
jgi:hypothetical protein